MQPAVLYLGIAVTLGLLGLMWHLRGRLNTWGFEWLSQRWTPARDLRDIVLGLTAGAILARLFRDSGKPAALAFARVRIGITLVPVLEELLFRGVLFSATEDLCRRWTAHAGWLAVFLVAAVFALAHTHKARVTPGQIVTIFGTGMLNGWLRLDTNSTVPQPS